MPDPDPDGRVDSWRTHRPCLESMPAGSTHLLVLQDDALPREDFAIRLDVALEQRPESVLLAFTPGFPHIRKLMREARTERRTLVRFPVRAFVPLVAIVYPRAVVDGLLSWSETPRRGADDGIVAEYCRRRRIAPFALVPCAVEHDHTVPGVRRQMKNGPHRRAALL